MKLQRYSVPVYGRRWATHRDNASIVTLDLSQVQRIRRLDGRSSGGSGCRVWLVDVNGFRCCMKELRKNEAVQCEVEDFEREVHILQRLPTGKHLIRFLGSVATPESLCAFQTVYDGDLDSYLYNLRQKQDKLTVTRVADLSTHILTALAILHSCGILHLDVKAANVFYIEMPSQRAQAHLVLGDFGEATDESETATHGCRGTMRWMAPEVMYDTPYSYPADMWSFGVLMFEMMSRRIPTFEDDAQARDGGGMTLDPSDERRYERLLPMWRSLLMVDPKVRSTADEALVRCRDVCNSPM